MNICQWRSCKNDPPIFSHKVGAFNCSNKLILYGRDGCDHTSFKCDIGDYRQIEGHNSFYDFDHEQFPELYQYLLWMYVPEVTKELIESELKN